MSATLTIRGRKQAGYTLLMVIFMVATMLVIAAAATPSILTQGRREKEQEMVWRGQQYARAIGLYYKKFGKYPTKIEDLTKPTNGVRFLRQAYPDPMNKEDGSWRFIYSGPNGQLIGSVRQTSLLRSTLSTTGLAGASPFGGGLQPLAPPGTAANQQQGQGAVGQQANPAAAANPLESQLQPFGGTVLGGNIAGVGSKIKKSSLRIYLGGDTYEQWEFIWNATGQAAVAGPAPVNPNANPTSGNAPAAPTSNDPNNPNAPQQPQQTPQPPTVNPPPAQ